MPLYLAATYRNPVTKGNPGKNLVYLSLVLIDLAGHEDLQGTVRVDNVDAGDINSVADCKLQQLALPIRTTRKLPSAPRSR